MACFDCCEHFFVVLVVAVVSNRLTCIVDSGSFGPVVYKVWLPHSRTS